MPTDYFEKLYIARTLLSLNQTEAGHQAGINQVTISSLERGERNAIPIVYANFLYKNGIDLNWVFNNRDDNDMTVFRKEENINGPADKLPDQADPANIFINHQLLETIQLTYKLTKHLEKLHVELSKMKRLHKIIKIKPGVNKHNRIEQKKENSRKQK